MCLTHMFYILIIFTKTLQSSFSDCQTPNKKIPDTTIKQFKSSLNQLINTLKSKEPSYIRCIKPNNYKEPGKFNNNIVFTLSLKLSLLLNTSRRSAPMIFRVNTSYDKFSDLVDWNFSLKFLLVFIQKNKTKNVRIFCGERLEISTFVIAVFRIEGVVQFLRRVPQNS